MQQLRLFDAIQKPFEEAHSYNLYKRFIQMLPVQLLKITLIFVCDTWDYAALRKRGLCKKRVR